MESTDTWQGKQVVVIGAARQGLALVRYLFNHGARVVLNDHRSSEQLQPALAELSDLEGRSDPSGGELEVALGSHPLDLLDGTDLVCLSGGVPLTLPIVSEAAQRKIALSNDSQIFLEVAPCPVIGVTGSAGKTTTTTLIGRMARAAVESDCKEGRTRRAWVGGNIGNPLIADVDRMEPDDIAVMELSSFQLEIMTRSPQVAVVLNITPNHLDRHPSMEAYTAAKARILAYQTETGAAILNRDDPGSWALAPVVKGRMFSFGRQTVREHPGTYLRGDVLYLWDGQTEQALMEKRAILLRGEHNLQNVLAACAAAAAAGFTVEAMRAGVEGFTGVSHRLEFVRTYHGADWYNDSIATAPERAIADIHAFDEPLILLAGGRDKNLPWETFGELVLRRVDHLILFGEAAEKIADAVEAARNVGLDEGDGRLQTIEQCAGLQQAVEAAGRIVEPGDVVLLSPGGTSFDEFRDFEQRGEAFRKWVKDLS